MKILARCLSCDRDFLLCQLTERPAAGGACPWCGAAVAEDYAPLFLDAIRHAERAGAALVDALKLLRDTGRGVRIDPGSILDPIRRSLGARDDESREGVGASRLRAAA